MGIFGDWIVTKIAFPFFLFAPSGTSVPRRRGALMLIALLLSIAFISYLYDWKADNSTLGAFTDKTVKAQNLLNKIWSIGESFFCVSRSRIGIHSFSVLTRT